jgi:hypothetical protein
MVMLAVGVVEAALAVEAPTGTATAAIRAAALAALHRDLAFLGRRSRVVELDDFTVVLIPLLLPPFSCGQAGPGVTGVVREGFDGPKATFPFQLAKNISGRG